MKRGKNIIAILLVFVLLSITTVGLSGCATHQYQGAGAGAVLGGITGALIAGDPWRGAVIGAGVGAITGVTLTDIAVRGSREAAVSGRPVEYRTQDGRGVYRAEPVSGIHRPDEHTKCRKVREKVWEDGRLVKDRVREVCEAEKFERRYIR